VDPWLSGLSSTICLVLSLYGIIIHFHLLLLISWHVHFGLHHELFAV
jgi:hypothetical protein